MQINMNQKTKKRLSKFILHLILIIGSATMLLPFIWMISASLKFEADIFKVPIEWIPKNITFNNYNGIFHNEDYNFGLFYFNSFKIASLVTIIQLLTSSIAAFAFAKIKFPGRDKIFLVYLTTLMVPFQVTMTPLFIIMGKLGLIDHHASIILMNAFNAFGVFMLRQFMLGIPEELSEAARIDGCSNFRIFRSIIFPNIKPALASLGLFTFLWNWNDFLKPLIFLNSTKNMTITLGLKTFVTEYNVEYGKILAGSTIALLPIIIIFFSCQKFFIEGIALSGLKG